MSADLSQIVARQMRSLPIEDLSKPKRQTLMEKLDAIRSRVPPEVWEKLPEDGAENLDHYLYGHAKKK